MTIDQTKAILLGLALGDALGWPTEFMSLAQIKQRYGPDGIQAPPDPALYTDDTQMTIALAEGLIEVGLDAPLDMQMQAIGARFIDWLHHAPSRAPGNTCISGMKRYESGMTWRTSGIAHSKGCGSAMRVAAIGYAYQHQPQKLYDLAVASSQITHGHPTAIAASVGAAHLVALALNGVPPTEYAHRLLAFTNGISAEFDAAIYRVGHCLGWTDQEAALKHIGEGWTGEEAVALALYCVLRHPDDYVACVRRAANTNGDSDSIACIAGGIMGARLGAAAIPADWIARCENRPQIEALAARLAAARAALPAA
jgi:ADP-ribosylglycohydrolase